MSPSVEMLGMAGLRSWLEQHARLDIEEMLGRVYSFGLAFSGQAQYQDDCTLVGLQIGD